MKNLGRLQLCFVVIFALAVLMPTFAQAQRSVEGTWHSMGPGPGTLLISRVAGRYVGVCWGRDVSVNVSGDTVTVIADFYNGDIHNHIVMNLTLSDDGNVLAGHLENTAGNSMNVLLTR